MKGLTLQKNQDNVLLFEFIPNHVKRAQTTEGDQFGNTAEDEGFEPSIGFPIHAFQACALGRYANPPEGSTLSVAITMITPDPSYGVIRTELPQGRNAARVGPLWRVCEGSY